MSLFLKLIGPVHNVEWLTTFIALGRMHMKFGENSQAILILQQAYKAGEELLSPHDLLGIQNDIAKCNQIPRFGLDFLSSFSFPDLLSSNLLTSLSPVPSPCAIALVLA